MGQENPLQFNTPSGDPLPDNTESRPILASSDVAHAAGAGLSTTAFNGNGFIASIARNGLIDNAFADDTVQNADALRLKVIAPKPTIAISDIDVRARVQWGQRLTPHFAIFYDKVLFAGPEVEMAAAALEEGYSAIFSLTHEAFPDRFSIFLIDQRATGLLGRTVRSHMNLDQRAIYLVRTANRSIFSELIHWLSHAMRVARFMRHYGRTPGWAMMEDAFATFLNVRLTTYAEAYPFFGAEADIIAHHVKESAQTGSLKDLWLSPKFAGVLERYLLAGAFFLYLGDTYSDDRVVAFSRCDGEITNDTFRIFFKKSLDGLEQEWVDHLPTAQLSLTAEDRRFVIDHWEKSMGA